MLGFRGQCPTKPSCYSVTLAQLRGARRDRRTEQARVHAGLLVLDPTTTPAVGHWACQRSGYSPGAGLLAADVWHRGELKRQVVAEEGP
ncbi:replication initiator [Streptomyces sp. NBC_00435]|uniref:replication initiator n=1 Tax=Streptomyces sp. NBC_00435 TaxID=2903649 RepID=UPI002E24216A